MDSIESDRVRSNTSKAVNSKIDDKTMHNILEYGNKSAVEIENRIRHLHKEWDIERLLEMNASMLSFIFVMLGFFLHRYWLFVPMVILPLLFLHAIQGWCPPLPILRRLKVRTQKEIDQEIVALKILRGDFNGLETTQKPPVPEIIKAIKK
jgi:hypothetical protein